ncbi:MAG: nucleotidyltransferase family protein [Eubacterium sp.]|nr:nucleotidyltransferase family protein [Eubacterium sp.]
MYKYDYEYLVHLLYCFIHGIQPDEKPEGISFKNVYKLGEIHEVSNIAFLSIDKLSRKPDAELYNEWKINYYFSFEREEKQKEEYEKIISLFHKNGIRTLEAQGTITKTLYPSSELRMMSDIDFIIDASNAEKAISLLEGEYEITKEKENEFNAHTQKGIELEFHNEFFTKTMYNRAERYYDAINHPFEHALPDKEDPLKYVLSDTYFYLYSVLHIIKHFETAGCGIRRILDLYYLKKAYENKIDNELISKIIDENGFRKSYDSLFALEELWFEGKESELDLGEAISDVISAGNHGTNEIRTRNTIRQDRSAGKAFPKLSKIFGFIFPKKSYLLITYPEAEEKGYSYVRCWLHRALNTLKRFDFSHFTKYIKTVLKSK